MTLADFQAFLIADLVRVRPDDVKFKEVRSKAVRGGSTRSGTFYFHINLIQIDENDEEIIIPIKVQFHGQLRNLRLEYNFQTDDVNLLNQGDALEAYLRACPKDGKKRSIITDQSVIRKTDLFMMKDIICQALNEYRSTETMTRKNAISKHCIRYRHKPKRQPKESAWMNIFLHSPEN